MKLCQCLTLPMIFHSFVLFHTMATIYHSTLFAIYFFLFLTLLYHSLIVFPVLFVFSKLSPLPFYLCSPLSSSTSFIPFFLFPLSYIFFQTATKMGKAIGKKGGFLPEVFDFTSIEEKNDVLTFKLKKDQCLWTLHDTYFKKRLAISNSVYLFMLKMVIILDSRAIWAY